MKDRVRNILAGMGSVLAIMPSGTVSSVSTPRKSDAQNLANDWQKVGHDLRVAMGQVDNEQQKNQ